MTRVRRFLHRAEFLLARALIFGIRRVSPDRASTIGGTVTRAIGPLLPVSASRTPISALPCHN